MRLLVVRSGGLLHDYGFCCLRKVNDQVMALPGLIVYVTNGEL